MSIEDRLKTVLDAESDCNRHSDNARLALKSMKERFREAATPWRIVTVGVIAGFVAGRSGGGGGANGESGGGLGGKLLALLAQSAITSLGAAASAGFAAEAATDPATEAADASDAADNDAETVSASDPA
jgi:hypothetical protein